MLTEEEKQNIVKEGLKSIMVVAGLYGYTAFSLPKETLKMMIDCYIEGAKMALNKINENNKN